MNKAFIKPMLDDIEWMCIHGHLKLLSIKHWDHETNTLTRIFWMSSEQLET
ncbi:hypothetical protein RhiirA5_434106 [Rhizophagus irregularis]|uniref:Uncharacterized protein n=1 Tax=Rhizophagus irregularis TaxID=588596 RepID=A0A2N0NQL3_9GLOM|nr:hypothetical protein RhiirA5_434106 [Rhizophagus irregularis]